LARSSIDEVAEFRVYRLEYGLSALMHTTGRGNYPPEKVKALRREGPKRGAKELLLIIEVALADVNRSAITNGAAHTIAKTA
jgi:hypothetical protein